MLTVLKAYSPFLVWLALALAALVSPLAKADEERAIVSHLRAADALIARGEWADAARLHMPPGAPPQVEAHLHFVRGLGAARAGYRAMAHYSIERLDALAATLAATDATAAARARLHASVIAAWGTCR